jgi:hypothetical protein
MPTKIKIFNEDYCSILEKEVNAFIESKELIDIKYTIGTGEIYGRDNSFSAMVIYREPHSKKGGQ